MSELLKIEDLKNELEIGEIGEQILQYDSGYVCDIITELADSNVDLYWGNLLEWAKGNTSYIDDALNEFGSPYREGKADFIAIIQQGQFYYYEQDLYQNLEDILKFYMYSYIQDSLGLVSITEEQNEELLDYDFSDNNALLENLIVHIENILNDKNVKN